MTYPQYAVSKWIGHSIEVSGRHYANAVPDELFDRASSKAPTPIKNGALQNALQQAAAGRCTAMKANGAACSKNAETREDFASLQERATPCNDGEQWSRGESNTRASSRKGQKNRPLGDSASKRAAKCAANPQPVKNPDISAIADAWSDLPEHVRSAILTLASATKGRR